MSGGRACRERGHWHVVLQRRCNHSAFNGYHWTRSDYSAVWCPETKTWWRTKAAYVDKLPDGYAI